MADWVKVKKSAQQVATLIEDSTGGCQNENALSELKNLALNIQRFSGGDSYVSDKLAKLLGFAEILYSSRRHRAYDTPQQNGVERLNQSCFNTAHDIMDWADLKLSQIK